MTTAAVAIFAYRRPLHLRRVLQALRPQLSDAKLPVHLFLDGPRTVHDDLAVQECSAISQQFVDAMNIQVHASAVNLGLFRSLTGGVSRVLERHHSVIVIEDDILVSPYCIRYMLDGLECYVADSRVASIHGYVPPINAPLPETFFLRGADCWGWATWRDRWSLFRSDAAAMAQELRQRGLSNAFDMGGRVPNLHLLDQRAEGLSNSWAICWHASCFLADRYTLHPSRSLVQNIGLDASGEHCLPSPALKTALSETPVSVTRQPVEEDPAIVRAFAKQVGRRSLLRRLFSRLASFGRSFYDH